MSPADIGDAGLEYPANIEYAGFRAVMQLQHARWAQLLGRGPTDIFDPERMMSRHHECVGGLVVIAEIPQQKYFLLFLDRERLHHLQVQGRERKFLRQLGESRQREAAIAGRPPTAKEDYCCPDDGARPCLKCAVKAERRKRPNDDAFRPGVRNSP